MESATYAIQTDPTHLTVQNAVLSTTVEPIRASTAPSQGVPGPEENRVADTSAQGTADSESPSTSPTSSTGKVPWKDQVIGRSILLCTLAATLA